MQRQVGQQKGGRQVVGVAGHGDVVLQAEGCRLAAQLGGKGTAPRVTQQQREGARRRQPCQGLQQNPLPFPPADPRRQQQHRTILRHPPGRAQGGDPRRVDGRRVEQAGVHAARDQPDARRIGVVPLPDQLGDEAGNGDHPLAARHHRVVATLAREILVVGAMIGCDETDTRAPRRPEGRPGREARPGMHDAHPFRRDQPLQRAGVAPQRQRRLAIQRQGDMARPQRFQLRHQPPSGRGHQRPEAGPGDGGGDLQRAALHPTRIQRGQDLQDGGRVETGHGAPGIRQIAARRKRAAGSGAGGIVSGTANRLPHICRQRPLLRS